MADEAIGAADQTANGPDHMVPSSWAKDSLQTKVATVGVIVVGAALIEVGLIPGMIVGVAATLAPKYVPQLGEALRPGVPLGGPRRI